MPVTRAQQDKAKNFVAQLYVEDLGMTKAQAIAAVNVRMSLQDMAAYGLSYETINQEITQARRAYFE